MTPEVRDRIDQIRHGNVPEGYTKTRSGIVPINWTPACLGDIYTERKEPGNESLPLLTVSIHSGVSDGELDEDELPKKVKRIEDKSQYKRAATGDLVFNMMRAWQGAIGTVRTEGMVSPAYIVAKPNDKVYPPFMDYYMKTPRMVGMINRQSYGVTDFRKRLYWDSFAPIPCVLPPVGKQRKIAEILSTQDKVIELQGRKIEELKRFKQGCQERMFPRKGQKVPEKRFPGFTADWEQRKFSDFTFSAGEKNKNSLPLEPYAITNEQGFIAQREAHNDFGYMQDVDRSMYLIVKPNSFAYNPARINVGSLGYYEGAKNVIVSSLYEVFQTTDDVEDMFLNQWFRTRFFKDWIEKLQEGSVRQYFYYDKLCECKIYIPSVEEQQQIGAFFKNFDNLITLHQRKLEEMKKQKKALMQLLLTGIVRV